MENSQSGVLLKKIKGVHFDSTAYPHLEEFAFNLGNELVSRMNEQVRGGEFEIAGVTFHALARERSLQGLEEKYLLYMSSAAESPGFLFVTIAAQVAAAFSEAMFGGDCVLDNSDCSPTSVDAAIFSKTLDKLMGFLTRYAYPKEAARRVGVATAVKSVPFTSSEVVKLPDITLCKVSFELGSGETKMPDAIIFHIPMNILEMRGLLTGRKRNDASEEENSWRQDLKTNIESSEIELCVVLDSYETKLSKLTNIKVGDILPLTDNTEQISKIILNTIDGPRMIGSGKLGVFRKNKAVKLLGPLDPVIQGKKGTPAVR